MCDQCSSLTETISLEINDGILHVFRLVCTWLDHGIIISKGKEIEDRFLVFPSLIVSELDYIHYEFVCTSCGESFKLYYNLDYSGKVTWEPIIKNPPIEIYQANDRLFYESGELRYEGATLSGRPNGQGIEYFENGKIHWEGWFRDGLLVEGKEYYENGNLRFEGDYNKGPKDYYGPRFFVKGKLYLETGELWYDGTFQFKRSSVGYPFFQNQQSFVKGTEYDKLGNVICHYPSSSNNKNNEPNAKVTKPRINHLLDAFLKACRRKYAKYTHYEMRRVKKEIRLYKGSRMLIAWDIPTDTFREGSVKNDSEQRMVRKFVKLPIQAEGWNQSQFHESDQAIEEILPEWKIELKSACMQLNDHEFTAENLKAISKKIALQYVDEWFGMGSSPDHYADQFGQWLSASIGIVREALLEFGDPRITKLIAKPSDPAYWLQYSEEQLCVMQKIIPLSAKRRGNLATIDDLQHDFFEFQCELALQFAIQYVQSEPAMTFVPSKELMIQWWEEDEEPDFSIANQKAEKDPYRSFRDTLLKQLEPKPKPTPNPSYLFVNVYYDESDQIGNVSPLLKMTSVHYGMLEWEKVGG